MSPAREAVILARGLGTRMRARGGQLDAAASSVADTGVKALIPIERPFIDYLLHDLAEAGIARVVVVIGPEHEAMRRHCRELTTSRLEIATAVQERPLGTADAAGLTRLRASFGGLEPLLVPEFGDEIEDLDGLARVARHLGGLAGWTSPPAAQ